tara:strand:- start:3739 stop:4356 length:618 start_codon:yes stop_codon:yes gene_type:complete
VAVGTLVRADGTVVCSWGEKHTDYARYHDIEWGVPITDDVRLYEKMCLEGFQSGLSWLTILRKRENFRSAFVGFEIEAVAKFGKSDVERLLNDAGIVRHRGKIEATITNARAALQTIETHGSLSKFFWSFEPQHHHPIKTSSDVAAATVESEEMSKALKKLGWRFVGPTTCYSLMQADGIVNDHFLSCFRHNQIETARTAAKEPI